MTHPTRVAMTQADSGEKASLAARARKLADKRRDATRDAERQAKRNGWLSVEQMDSRAPRAPDILLSWLHR